MSDPDSNSDFRINLDVDVRRIPVPKLWIHSSASFISPSLVQIGCWLYENWENTEMLTNVGKSIIPQWWRKWKSGIHAQIRITTKSQPLLEGHLLPVPAKFRRRQFPRSSVILFTEWQNEWKNERERSHNIRLILTEVIIIKLVLSTDGGSSSGVSQTVTVQVCLRHRKSRTSKYAEEKIT